MERKQITEEEIIGRIDTSFDSVEKLRSEGLERIKLFHSIKSLALEKEHKRLSEKLGVDNPRVKKMAARMQYNQGLFKDIDVEIEKARIKVPPLKENSWMVHGMVFDKNIKGIDGLTAGLYDQEGNLFPSAKGCTDGRGYFSIKVMLKTAAAEEPTPPLYLRLFENGRRPVYQDESPMELRTGQVVYREIMLNRAPQVCEEPPVKVTQEAPVAKKGRYLGNSAKKELHDLNNVQKRCLIEKIGIKSRVYFRTEKEAINKGYDYCAYCFGKENSKR